MPGIYRKDVEKMMLVIIFLLVLLLIFCHTFRQLVLHPIRFPYYMIKDLLLYFIRRKWHECPTGHLVCYFAHFGGGKTLSATQFITRQYHKYNNKLVYDRERRKMVTQKIEILSNAEFTGVPYVPLNALSDITARATHNKGIDLENDTLTVTIILIDEASSELNSREYKNNFDMDTLNTLITCRHYHLDLYYTSQKFKLADALLRAVTQECILCRKFWRIMVKTGYSADQLEVAGDALLVKPLYRKSFFITDRVYNGYNTLATVDKLKKGAEMGKMLTAQEILALRGSSAPDADSISTPSRRLKRMRKGK